MAARASPRADRRSEAITRCLDQLLPLSGYGPLPLLGQVLGFFGREPHGLLRPDNRRFSAPRPGNRTALPRAEPRGLGQCHRCASQWRPQRALSAPIRRRGATASCAGAPGTGRSHCDPRYVGALPSGIRSHRLGQCDQPTQHRLVYRQLRNRPIPPPRRGLSRVLQPRLARETHGTAHRDPHGRHPHR